MTGAAKILMVSSTKKNGNRGQRPVREERESERERREMNNYWPDRRFVPPYGGDEPDMDGEPEARRMRRYKNGRFAPRSYDPDEMRMGEYDQRPGTIGFRYEEDSGRYGTRADYERMNEMENRTGEMQRGSAKSKMREGMGRKNAEEWTRKMQNADGTTGPHWDMANTEKLMKQIGADCDPVEFYVAMNMVFSDYCKVARKHGVNNVEFYADLAKAFLDDKDAVPDKLATYYECIVK